MKAFVLLLTVVAAAAAAESNETDPVSGQLLIYKEKHQCPFMLTTAAGAPVTLAHATNTLNTELIDNDHFMHLMGKLVRERIPERTVHAQGSGAFGYLEVTHDISHICKADFLNKVGKKTPVAVRFSTSHGSLGSPDCNLDIRGFSVKMYTKEGIFDMAGFNSPTSSFKEPLDGHNVIHTARRNPQSNCFDANMSWDKYVLIPEALHLLMYTYAGRGLPADFKNMAGFSTHTYQVENKDCVPSFCRLHYLPDAGLKYMPAEEASKIRASDPDYLAKNLFRQIGNGDFPSWTLYFQCFSEAEAKKKGSYRLFDITRTLPEDKYPLIKVARLVLNRNPTNHFAEVEKLAFCPCHVVPGILGAPDQIYRARRIIYADGQNYRVGGNVHNIPVNHPFRAQPHTYDRDGVAPSNIVGDPNYYPNSFNGPQPYEPKCNSSLIKIIEKPGADNLDQMTDLYTHGLTDEERNTLIKNLATSLKPVVSFLQEKALGWFTKIHKDFGKRLAQELNVTLQSSY